jgi:dihydropteroate synthase
MAQVTDNARSLQLMRQWQDPRTQRKLKEVYHDLLNPRTPKTVQKDVQQQMRTVSPLSTNTTLYPRDVRRTTHIMSILNTTPDSFSDGGSNTLDLQSLRETAASHIAAGATIIDVGGQSSRPNAPDVTPEEEISRVLPAIAAIKSLPEAEGVSISVDTYRAAVAEAAVNAGAHIINDISAGALDPQMLPTVARLGCTYIMMHMRGTPATMQNRENCTYASGLYGEMRNELASSVAIAVASGVRKWRIIVDPGLGFAKDQTQNLRLLRSGLVDNTKMYRRRPGVGEAPLLGMPQLIGCSRKGFIGKITGVEEPKDRIWGTAAAVTASVAAGADIVRVHDVKEMAQVVKMADAIYRPMADVG